MARGIAEQVALRLVAAGELIDEDPETALGHTLVARRLASRIPAVREAVGLAAYHAGQWQTAIGELRAYHRMSGQQTHLAVLADCERALGRPERAIDMYRATDRDRLAPDEAVELLIVVAGARADLGQHEAAVTMLQVSELAADEPWVARLRYAYADALLTIGRRDEAREWFARAAEVDEDAATDAAERLLDLDGVVLDDHDDDSYGAAQVDHEDEDDDEDEDEDDEDEAYGIALDTFDDGDELAEFTVDDPEETEDAAAVRMGEQRGDDDEEEAGIVDDFADEDDWQDDVEDDEEDDEDGGYGGDSENASGSGADDPDAEQNSDDTPRPGP